MAGKPKFCIVCERQLITKIGDGPFLCSKCQQSLNSSNHPSGMDLINWAAERARTFERQRYRSIESQLETTKNELVRLRKELSAVIAKR